MSTLSDLFEKLSNRLLPFEVDKGTPHEIVEELIKYGDQRIEEILSLKVRSQISEDEVLRKVSNASVIFFSDLHDSPEVKQKAADFLGYMKRINSRPKVVIAEWVFARYQDQLDGYLRDKITVDQLRKRIKFDAVFASSWWPPYAQLLEFLKRENVRVLAAFKGDEKTNWADIRPRDAFVVELIRSEIQRDSTTQVFVLHGLAHVVGQSHLADQVSKIFPGRTITLLNSIGRLNWAILKYSMGFDKSLIFGLDGLRSDVYYYTIASKVISSINVLKDISDGFVSKTDKKAKLTSLATTIDRDIVEIFRQMKSDQPNSGIELLKQVKKSLGLWTSILLDKGSPLSEPVLERLKPVLLELETFSKTAPVKACSRGRSYR